MAIKIKKRDGYPSQIHGCIVGSMKHCNDELVKKIDTYIKKHNDLYPKRRDYLKFGIKSHEVSQYIFSLSDERSNSYMLSYIVNFYK